VLGFSGFAETDSVGCFGYILPWLLLIVFFSHLVIFGVKKPEIPLQEKTPGPAYRIDSL